MLREKQIAFCKEYVRCKNPELAALNAGYNPHYGKVLLSRSEIADFCSRQEANLAARLSLEISDMEENVGEKASLSLSEEEKSRKTKFTSENESSNAKPIPQALAQKAPNGQNTEVERESPQPPPPNSPQNNNGIATPEDVLRFLTDIMNGEEAMRDKLRAAELLGKRYGLFKETADEEENKCLVIVGEDKL